MSESYGKSTMKKKKRILFVVPFLSSGGAERVVSIWANELARKGLDIHLLLFYRISNEYYIDKKVAVSTISKGKKEYENLTKIEKILEIRKKLIEIKPDIIVPFLAHVGIMTNVARVGLNIKLVETIRIDPKYSPANIIVRILRNTSVLVADRLILQNNEQKKYFPISIQKKSTVFPNPISNEFISDSKKEIKRVKNIVAVGRLEPQKNYPMLINAFSKIRDENVRLNIYGEGSLYDELTSLIKSLKLNNRVFLHGRTTNIKQVLLNSDLFILSSNAEGMPNSLMEAMALGLPCISTDCPTGPADLINHNENGLLIPVKDEEALIESINFVIDFSEKAFNMGIKARKEILSKYTAEISTENILHYFYKI